MVSFVKGDLADADTWPREDIAAVVAAMAAEAGLPEPDVGREVVARGRDLVASGERCGACHAFGDNGTDLGSAPDLNGWGGREWLVGIITDPTHARFYGDSNDRMPRFGVADEGENPALTESEIGIVADWLRGQWYRAATH